MKRSVAYIHTDNRLLTIQKELLAKLIRWGLLFLFLGYLLYNPSPAKRAFEYLYGKVSNLNQNKMMPCITSKKDVQEGLLPIEISIPKKDIKISVKKINFQKGTWKITSGVANYAIGTSMIDMQKGNTGIFGYENEDFFTKIIELRSGDSIEVIAQNIHSKIKYLVTYEVITSGVVNSKESGLFYPTETSQITILANGDNFNDIKYVVTAKPLLIKAVQCDS
jgi:hypothetical protein